MPTLGSQLLPNFKERDFLMHWLTQPGTSVTEETRVSVSACKDLQEIEGVRNCGSHIGQAYLADEVYGVDFGENWISVSPDVDYDKTLDEVHKVVEYYPGLYRDVQTYLRERIKEVLTGASESIVVRIYGPDLPTLQKQAKDIEQRIGDIPGIEDAHASLQTDLPHIEVEPDLAKAREFGLTPGDIRRQASTLIASEEVSDIFSGGKAYDVHVTAIPSARDSVSDVQNLQLDTPSGGHVRLQDVADVRMGPTPNAILREQQSRYIDVGANVAGRPLNEVVDDVEKRMEGVTFPLGYHAEVIGESTELDAAEDTLLIFGIAAAVATLLLLHVAFGSFRPALLTFAAAAHGAGRRCNRSVAQWPGAVARFTGRLPRGLWDRRAQRDLDGQPLPALGARRGRQVRRGAGHPRCQGTSGADHDDRTGDRPGARSARGCWQHSGARDRASHGDRDPRRPGHRDLDQLVRAAVALLGLWQEQAGSSG